MNRWPWKKRDWFIAAQMYSRDAGAFYVGGWSLHWAQRGPVFVEDGQVITRHERPRRAIVLYRGVVHKVFEVSLWRLRGWCDHGYRTDAWWHRCDYVSAANPEGRPSDRELWPEDYADEDPIVSIEELRARMAEEDT